MELVVIRIWGSQHVIKLGLGPLLIDQLRVVCYQLKAGGKSGTKAIRHPRSSDPGEVHYNSVCGGGSLSEGG